MADDRLGRVLIPVPSFARWVVASLAVFVALAACLVLTARYQHRIRCAGELVPENGSTPILSTVNAHVGQVWVRDGQSVAAGDALVELVTDIGSAATGTVHASIAHTFQAEQALLQRRRGDLDDNEAAERRILQKRTALLQDRKHSLAAQLELEQAGQAAQAGLADKFRRAAERGLLSRLQEEQQQVVLIESRARVEALRRQQVELDEEAERIAAELAQLTERYGKDRSALAAAIAELDRRSAENGTQQALLIRATRSGRIANLTLKPGQAITAGMILGSLVPEDARYIGEIWLSSADLGRVKVGSPVNLRYDAFPYRRYGQFAGVVEQVAIAPQEPVAPAPSEAAARRRYRVAVRLQDASARQAALGMGLHTGMTFAADIIIERRRVRDWIRDAAFGASALERQASQPLAAQP